METLEELLKGGDLRVLKGEDEVIRRVKTQADFDALFKLIFNHDRHVVMRAADAVEKITRSVPSMLQSHAPQLFMLLKDHATIELKWHLAQLLPRLELSESERDEVWQRLRYWVANRSESKIVRVNALEGMFNLFQSSHDIKKSEDFRSLVTTISREQIPSIDARIRKLRSQALSKRPNKILRATKSS